MLTSQNSCVAIRQIRVHAVHARSLPFIVAPEAAEARRLRAAARLFLQSSQSYDREAGKGLRFDCTPPRAPRGDGRVSEDVSYDTDMA